LLLGGAKKVIAVEKDTRFIPALEILQRACPERMDIVVGDALKVDEAEILENAGAEKRAWHEDAGHLHVVGNLPFQISTELLLKWIHQMPQREGAFEFGRATLTLLFQKEVADRIVAQPKMPDFSRLSVMTGHCAMALRKFNIRGKAFVPPPDVDAGIVNITPRIEPLIAEPTSELEYVLRRVFGQRRKMLRNSVSTLDEDGRFPNLGTVALEKSGVDPTKRPTQTTIKEWGKLTRGYMEARESFNDDGEQQE